MQLLARMALNHEDELVQMRYEKEFLISMDVREHGILNTMYEASLAWKDKHSEQAATTSLSYHMFHAMIQEWSNRLQKLKASPEAQESPMAKHGPSNELDWIYLKWNAQNSSLEEDTSKEPISTTNLEMLITALAAAVKLSGVVVKFHSTRPLVADHQSVVTFPLAIGLRDQAANIAYRTLQTFCANGATRLIAIRMKPTKMERQPLAKIVAEKSPPPKPRGEWYPRGSDSKPSDMQGDSK